jgi:hypothetical protein
MLAGGKKFEKPKKTKFKENRDNESYFSKNLKKNRHHDKSFYRLVKQEQDEYAR